jgi:predicted DNA-binding transcriptional regulator YafY
MDCGEPKCESRDPQRRPRTQLRRLIERVETAVLTPRSFEAPDPATTTVELRRAWDIIADQPATDIVLRFAPSVATRVNETVWHPTQTVTIEPDGSLTWRATVAGTIEIRLWILSWGDDVEVLEPPGLRSDVAATHGRAESRYHS